MTFPSERALRGLVALGALAVASSVAPTARAETPDNLQHARTEYAAALENVKQARWSEALAAFERSAAARPHVLTTYNIGACERALGHYLRARAALTSALATDDAAAKHELPASFAADAKKWVAEIDTLLAHVTVTPNPGDAQVLVDGAQLPEGTARGASFELSLDPGTHLFSISRPGFVNALVSKTFAPGTRTEVALDLTSLPATIQISANRAGAVVSVDGVDVGVAPVSLSRPAGAYQIAVKKAGYLTYVTKVKVAPGDHPALAATLPEETSPLYKKGWFWGAAVAVVAGAAAVTYFAVRPSPERPAPDGGGLGWTVPIPAPSK